MWKLTSKKGLRALSDKHVAGICVLLLFGWFRVVVGFVLNFIESRDLKLYAADLA